MDLFQQRIVYLWYTFTFFVAPITDGLAPFVSVYLVAYADVSPGDAGLIWFTRDISQMIFQVPMGAFVDYTTHKKSYLMLFATLSTLMSMVIIFTHNIPILLVKSVIEGFAAASLRVFMGPFTLGIAGHENFENTANNAELFEYSGSLVACTIAGVIGYTMYPDVLQIFYVIGAFGFLAILGLLLMGQRRFINDDCARNSNHGALSCGSKLNTDNAEAEDSSEVKKTLLEPRDANAQDGKMACTETAPTDVEDSCNDEESTSLWTIFVEQRGMTYFSLSIFFFHLGNAAVLPVLGQVLALEDGKTGIAYTAGNIALAQLSSFVGFCMIEYFVAKGFKCNIPTGIGFGLLIPRIAIILLVLRHSRNPYLLIATQVFDGIGAGVNGLAVMRVTKTLTEGTKRFGIVFSIVNVCHAIGGALSNLISGYLIDAWSYEVGFVFLLFPGFVSIFFVYMTRVESPPQPTDLTNDNNDLKVPLNIDPPVKDSNHTDSLSLWASDGEKCCPPAKGLSNLDSFLERRRRNNVRKTVDDHGNDDANVKTSKSTGDTNHTRATDASNTNHTRSTDASDTNHTRATDICDDKNNDEVDILKRFAEKCLHARKLED